jgi:proteasome lid subunit RPN8/RPN11
VIVLRTALAELRKYAEESAPMEAAGQAFVARNEAREITMITGFVKLENRASGTGRFSISIRGYARDQLVVWHSHPTGPAVPSQEDWLGVADAMGLVYSLEDDKLTAYWIKHKHRYVERVDST